MKLQRLLQKCSFCSPIRLAVFGPEAAARMKLHHCNYSPQSAQSDAEIILNTLSQRSLRALRYIL